MTRRCRQHVNPLKMTSLVPRKGPLALPAGRQVEVELGCGDARFLVSRARLFPQRYFLGLDIRDAFLQDGREQIQELQLDNIELEVSNLIVDYDRLFAPKSVLRFYINFPDPWFKERQHNRRWLSQPVLDQLALMLEPQGEFFFQSDVWNIALEAFGYLEACPFLDNMAGEWSFYRDNPFAVQSSREIACQEASLPIWRMRFKRNSYDR